MISPDILFTLGSAFGIGVIFLVVHVLRERGHASHSQGSGRQPAE